MTKNHYIFTLLLFFTAVYLLPLGARPLMIPDESRYAEIPREMVTSGDWLVPKINNLTYYEKPPMGYWVHALALKWLGETNFAVRLPSALATGLVALLISIICGGVIGWQDNRVYLAPLIYLSSMGVFGITSVTVLDNVLNFFLTASVVLFFLATERRPRCPAEKMLLVLAGSTVGCAFMTKGFLAFVVPIITVVPYLFWQKRGREIFRLLLLPALSSILVSLPWAVMIHLRDPEFWNFFFWHEHIKRFFSEHAQHAEPFWFYLVAVWPIFSPWALLLPSAFAGFFTGNSRSPGLTRIIGLSVCWVLFPLLFFSLSNGKLATYILPCIPPLAILSAIGLCGSTKAAGKLLNTGIFILIIIATAALAGLVGSQILSFDTISLPESIWQYDADKLRYSASIWKPALISAALVVMAVLLFFAWRCRDKESKLLLVALSSAMFMISSCYALPDLTLTVKAPGPFLEREAADIAEDAIIFSDPDLVTIASWQLKRDDLFVLPSWSELNYGLMRPENKHRMPDIESIIKLINSDRKRDVVVLVKTKRWKENYSNLLPEPLYLSSSGKYGYSVAKF
jgi:4-amino-4-deoxy-L-arabinose transferase